MNLGEEIEVRAGKKTWTLSRLTVGVLFGFRDWIKSEIGDPYSEVERLLPHLDKAEALTRIKEAESVARQLRQFSMQSPLAQAYMQTELGAAKLFQLLLKEHHPQATEDDGLAVAMELGQRRLLEDTLARAQGHLPEGSVGPGGNATVPAAST